MKKESAIYIVAFLLGVIGTNILESKSWINAGYLQRHQLLQFTFSGIRYDSYLIELLFQRLKIVGLLWLLGKVISPRWIRFMFGGILCTILGCIMTSTILANGLWGVVLFGGMLFPQCFLYAGAYVLWGKLYNTNYIGKVGKNKIVINLLLLMSVILGCILEAYINPFVFCEIIKY